jgi:AcrR family transcriptional regulator
MKAARPAADRRDTLLAAVMRIAADRGLDEVSFREVAAESGVSLGTVQYYFPNKDALVRAAFAQVVEQITARLLACERGPSAADSLRRILEQLIPLDELRRLESRVYLAFAARAAVVPELRDIQHASWDRLRTFCRELIRSAQRDGTARADVDASIASAGLVAVVDGLLLHMLTDPSGLTSRRATAILRQQLAAIFG